MVKKRVFDRPDFLLSLSYCLVKKTYESIMPQWHNAHFDTRFMLRHNSPWTCPRVCVCVCVFCIIPLRRKREKDNEKEYLWSRGIKH